LDKLAAVKGLGLISLNLLFLSLTFLANASIPSAPFELSLIFKSDSRSLPIVLSFGFSLPSSPAIYTVNSFTPFLIGCGAIFGLMALYCFFKYIVPAFKILSLETLLRLTFELNPICIDLSFGK
jgi:hypothetical protein